MKVVLALALAFLAIGAYGTALFNGALSDPNVNMLTLTSGAADQNTATNWGFALISNSATFQGDDDLNSLHLIFNATFTGQLPRDGSGFPLGIVSFSRQAYNWYPNGCDTLNAENNGFYITSATLDNTGNFLQYETYLDPYFTTAGATTGTVTLYYPPGTQVAQGTFDFTVAAPLYTAEAGSSPTVSAWSILPQRASIYEAGANITIANAAPGTYYATVYYTATTGNQGVAWGHECRIDVAGGATTGSCTDHDFGYLRPYIGSWCGLNFNGGSTGVDMTANLDLQLAGVEIYQSNSGVSVGFSGGDGAFNSGRNMKIVTGDADILPPTCTTALFDTPLAVTTANSPISKTLTITCTDAGVGTYLFGAYIRAQSGSLTYDSSVGGSVNNAISVGVPLHYSGSLSVIGVWCMDDNGNTVVYGSCDSTQYGTVCGGSGSGSGSSAVVASISLVIALILAVLAL